ncbi:hypothetical protein [Abyssibius alkaniclasticus]|uniref:hypothetical protein n=1 Tax=Abyssibius alkaniclasticus TaxID=2881234 RepID=UPI0040587D95
MSIYSPPAAGPARQIYARKRLSALEKSAVIVAHLHPDQAATVLRGLRADDLRRFSAALQAVRGLGDSAVKGVIREFLAALNAAPTIDDGTEAARSLLGGLLDAPIVDRLLSEVGMSKLNLWAMIASMSADEIAALLAGEHPQTIGYVLGRLAPDQARNVLAALPKPLAQQSVLAMDKAKLLSDETTGVIEAALSRLLLQP